MAVLRQDGISPSALRPETSKNVILLLVSPFPSDTMLQRAAQGASTNSIQASSIVVLEPEPGDKTPILTDVSSCTPGTWRPSVIFFFLLPSLLPGLGFW